MRAHLTEITVRNLKPSQKQVKVWDTTTPGFGVIVGKSKSYFVMFGKDRAVKVLGRYPETTLSEARLAAKKLLVSDEKSAGGISFTDALNRFLEAQKAHLKPRSLYELERTLKRHFGFKKALPDITHSDIAAVVDGIEAKSEASHALKDIKTFFNWCIPRYLKHSPSQGIRKPHKYVPRERVLTDAELKRVWRAAEQMGGYGVQVQLLITLGQRANQIISLAPEWVNGKDRLITFPASVMKGNRDHTIPYGDLTRQLLQKNTARPTSYQGKMKRELDKISETSDWVLHDLRRVLASQWAALGVSLPTIEMYLAHRSHSFAGIVSVYQKHSWLPEMREAVEKWEAKLTTLLNSSA